MICLKHSRPPITHRLPRVCPILKTCLSFSAVLAENFWCHTCVAQIRWDIPIAWKNEMRAHNVTWKLCVYCACIYIYIAMSWSVCCLAIISHVSAFLSYCCYIRSRRTCTYIVKPYLFGLRQTFLPFIWSLEQFIVRTKITFGWANISLSLKKKK